MVHLSKARSENSPRSMLVAKAGLLRRSSHASFFRFASPHGKFSGRDQSNQCRPECQSLHGARQAVGRSPRWTHTISMSCTCRHHVSLRWVSIVGALARHLTNPAVQRPRQPLRVRRRHPLPPSPATVGRCCSNAIRSAWPPASTSAHPPAAVGDVQPEPVELEPLHGAETTASVYCPHSAGWAQFLPYRRQA